MEVRPWLRLLFVLGHISSAAIHLVIGGLALLAAFGEGGKVGGEDEAIKTIGEQRLGRYLLLAASAGLARYALWRLLYAAFNLDRKRGAAGGVVRLGGLVSAVVHASLALMALQLAAGRPAQTHEGRSRVWVDRALDQPFGDALVMMAGLTLLGFALHQLFRATTGKLSEELDVGPHHSAWMGTAGRLGLAARGVVFTIIGARLIRAGLDDSSHHTRELGSAPPRAGRSAQRGDLARRRRRGSGRVRPVPARRRPLRPRPGLVITPPGSPKPCGGRSRACQSASPAHGPAPARKHGNVAADADRSIAALLADTGARWAHRRRRTSSRRRKR